MSRGSQGRAVTKTSLQSQKAVTAHLKSEQLLAFGFAWQKNRFNTGEMRRWMRNASWQRFAFGQGVLEINMDVFISQWYVFYQSNIRILGRSIIFLQIPFYFDIFCWCSRDFWLMWELHTFNCFCFKLSRMTSFFKTLWLNTFSIFKTFIWIRFFPAMIKIAVRNKKNSKMVKQLQT